MRHDDDATGSNGWEKDWANGDDVARPGPLDWGARVIGGHRGRGKAISLRTALIALPLVIALTTGMTIFAANALGQPEVTGRDARAALEDATDHAPVGSGPDGTFPDKGSLTAEPSPRTTSINGGTSGSRSTSNPPTHPQTTKPPGAPAPTIPQGPTTITYPNFADVSGLAFNGKARQNSDFLRLVAHSETKAAGSAWSRKTLDPARSFSTSFRVWLQQDGGDGLAFVVQSEGVGAIGLDGCGLGYGDEFLSTVVSPSMAVEFDTYDNWWEPDAGDNAIAITRDGNIKSQLGSGSPAFYIWGDGAFNVWVDYDAVAHTVRVSPACPAGSPLVHWSAPPSTCPPLSVPARCTPALRQATGCSRPIKMC